MAVAEETGLNVAISWWVLRQTCEQMQQLQNQFPTNPALRISVDFTAQQFAQPNLLKRLTQILV